MNPLKPDGSDWDAVDQASFESFPASDPPARGSLRAAPSASTVTLEAFEQPGAGDSEQLRRYLRIGLGVLAGGLAIGIVIWRMRAR